MSRQRSLLEKVSTGENRSVSPVIGVILMVAVTVILAAVIGATAFGVADSIGNSPPQADLSATQGITAVDDNITSNVRDYRSVTITHESGEDISKENIEVTVNGEPAYATVDPARKFYDQFPGNQRSDVLAPWDSVDSDTISAGDKTIIVFSTNRIENENLRPSRNDITFNHLGLDPDDDAVTLWIPGNPGLDYQDIKLESGDTVRMVWESGDSSTPLVEHEISD